MRKPILLFAGVAGLFLFACIVAPNEPSGTSGNGLTCASNQRAFNGGCHQVCAKNADCPSGNSCMKVSGDVALCLDYQHCAFLGSDTSCHRSGAGYGYASASDPYDPYETYYPYEPHGGGSTYGYVGPSGCSGNAQWQVIPPSGDPQCGVAHAVSRCAPVGTGCGLVSGSTVDVADP